MLQSPTPKKRRRGRLFRFSSALVVLLAVAGYLVVQYVTGGRGGPGCKVVSGKDDGQEYEFSQEQTMNAATIAAVGTGRGMPERAVTIALATALQESQLVNIQHGDLDSLGLFQQRPSQGWGTKKEILDPTYAAGVFYEHLSKVDDYQQLPLTVAAQRVQRSGYPEAYAKHEPEATLLSAALTGQAAATLTCQGLPDSTQTAVGPDAVRAALVRDFGRTVLKETGAEVTASGSASKGTSKAKAESTPSPSASATGGSSTVTLPVRTGSTKTGWQLAHWAVANSSELHIERVSYAGREWAAGSADDPWHSTATKASGGVRIVTSQQGLEK
ncbi:heavy metal transporter [Streptomyces prunicolor]|uniref:Heavy metal transporter n=1 Tax=Streptomyces prunicolor TaxID=67348 RepID=A0ABU4FQ92_9ACTN|nr:heavy metal transporter [Streptomyces prunicolor]MCX5237332.1 heavy metal transporter [Streptomyces prunicolor]MDV7222111.1 heavy metal transporter [Streptomyces prunicolor]